MLSRVSMPRLEVNNKQAFYTYVMPQGERPDNLSYNYYNNPDYVWLIGLTNQIIDPYYDFPLSDDDLNTYVINTYGGISQAQNTILFFRTNWASDPSILSVTAYNALGVGQQKYWAPTLGYSGKIVSYVRKKEDWTVTTNMVIAAVTTIDVELLTEDGYVIDTSDNYDIVWPEGGSTTVSFQVGEQVTQNGVVVGTVAAAGPDILMLQHIDGTATTITAGEIDGVTSGAAATILSTSLISQNIPDNEAIYWSPVYAYDYEKELNDNRKHISLLDNRFAETATTQVKNLFL